MILPQKMEYFKAWSHSIGKANFRHKSSCLIILSNPPFPIGKPVINFTQSVYNANEYKKAVVDVYVTQNKVIAPATVR